MLLLALTPMASTQVSSLREEVVVMNTETTTIIPQFGTGFDETLIADSSDDLDTPRDLEFHPGATRSDELWIVNRATDSITIIHDTGTENQWSENREDAYANHFMEEVSAISFGSYNSEFDFQFGTAQESRNTFNGQGSPNNFMGPTLWPSSLSHYAVEHQADDLLGSHLDMQHESPNGMGIAHDSGNAYWYFDGYYGNLVYYDFQVDHDTGEDDHSDGIVRRYSDITLTRWINIPSHMILDKDSGILYISDTGANRVLWVNTDDTTVTTTNIMNDNSRMEPLEEYSRVTGMEWGVLDTGLSKPSGIALDGDTLFVGTNGDDSITAYDLSTDGKSGTLLETVSTSAFSLMGIEIGPDGKLYYVDGNKDKVFRLDPWPDADGDGIQDSIDNCVDDANNDQADYDSDNIGNVCDPDTDGDTILNADDMCPMGMNTWISDSVTDHDGDGCADDGEDQDDDSDTVYDFSDSCRLSPVGWISESTSDYDLDGCRDSDEDLDDDSDGICDVGGPASGCIKSSAQDDLCHFSPLGFISTSSTDFDGDGCEDYTEDDDDDADGFSDLEDKCNFQAGSADQGNQIGCPDSDGDGWADLEDVFPSDPTQWLDFDEDGYGNSPLGTTPDGCITIEGNSTIDRYGCIDSDGDGYSNPDSDWTALEGADAFPYDDSQWFDTDGDGFGDNLFGTDADECVTEFGNSTIDRLGCLDSDGDGYSDLNDAMINEPTQWSDHDGDGFGDNVGGVNGDSCWTQYGTSSMGDKGCFDADSDGWNDLQDVWPDDGTRWSDSDSDGFPDQQELDDSDFCPEIAGTSTADRIGCLDSDGDGTSDENDFYPQDATRSVEEDPYENWLLWVSIIAAIVIIASITLFFMIRKGSNSTGLNKDYTDGINAIPQPQLPLPLPPEGLPPGWTMEQWNWYGEDWLRSQGRL
jgi:hypothetical protein